MTHRIHNFSAGPAALPLPVLERVQAEFLDFEGTGMSVIEMSHRSGPIEAMHDRAIADLRALLGIPEGYQVLFMQGGARGQFAFLAMNLLQGGPGLYVDTGTWSQGAFEEGRKIGPAEQIWSGQAEHWSRVPRPGELVVRQDAAYLHTTSNNTIFGTEYQYVPEAGAVPLVCDMSSDIASGPVDVGRYAMIYAGAQKNMGPAGVTVVVIRDELLERSPSNIAETFSYKKMAASNSMLNTPPVFGIYVVGLVARYLLDGGGLPATDAINRRKADTLYAAIDGSGGFYRGHAQADSRSRMNVTFRIGDEALEKRFVAEATAAGLNGLKGHRSVGGLRASIYNAVSQGSVEALVGFMEDFQARNG